MEIKLLKKHGYSLRQIAQETGCAVNTIRRHLALSALPIYQRKVNRMTKLAAYEPYLQERQASARPDWLPATVLYREIAALGYQGGFTQLRAYIRTLRSIALDEPIVRFETLPGEQMQIDWVEFRRGRDPLYAFCATLGYSRASFVEFVTDMKVQTLIACHQHAFETFTGVTKAILYDNVKTIVLERNAYADGQHRFHPTFLDYAKHCGFRIRLCRPYRAKTKGKVERFNGYLRYSFYVPLVSKLKQSGLKLDVVTANHEVKRWLKEVANERQHGTTQVKPSIRLAEELIHLQPIPKPWCGHIRRSRPQQPKQMISISSAMLPVLEQQLPSQHSLAAYDALFERIAQGADR